MTAQEHPEWGSVFAWIFSLPAQMAHCYWPPRPLPLWQFSDLDRERGGHRSLRPAATACLLKDLSSATDTPINRSKCVSTIPFFFFPFFSFLALFLSRFSFLSFLSLVFFSRPGFMVSSADFVSAIGLGETRGRSRRSVAVEGCP